MASRPQDESEPSTVAFRPGGRSRVVRPIPSSPRTGEIDIPIPARPTNAESEELHTQPIRKSREIPAVKIGKRQGSDAPHAPSEAESLKQRDKSQPPSYSGSPLSADAPRTPRITCPRCDTELVNPGSLGLCPSCGYCRALERSTEPAEEQSQPSYRTSTLGIREFWELSKTLPSWFYVLLSGAAVIILVSIIAGTLLPGNSLPRALWATIQLVLGLLMAVLAHEWALLLIASQDEKIGAVDAVLLFSARVWKLAIKMMPSSRTPICLAVLGLVTMLSAVLCVGGLTYWLPGK